MSVCANDEHGNKGKAQINREKRFIKFNPPTEAHLKAKISSERQEKAFDAVWCDIWLYSTVHAHMAVNPVTSDLLRDP